MQNVYYYPNTNEGWALLKRIEAVGIIFFGLGAGYDPYMEPELSLITGEDLRGYNAIGKFLDSYESPPKETAAPTCSWT